MMKVNARDKGFTTVELVVTLAIVIVLATILTPALLNGKSKAKSIACINNQKQLSGGLSLFIDSYNEYPLFVNPGFYKGLHKEHLQHWTAAIWVNGLGNSEKDAFQASGKGVFKCPASKIPKNWPERKGWSDFGYNSYGSGTASNSLGLGLLEKRDEEYIPVPESLIQAPSGIYVIADGLKGLDMNLEDGSGLIGRGPLPYTMAKETEKRILKRHNKAMNILFADGHVDSRKIKEVFESDKGWNISNQ